MAISVMCTWLSNQIGTVRYALAIHAINPNKIDKYSYFTKLQCFTQLTIENGYYPQMKNSDSYIKFYRDIFKN